MVYMCVIWVIRTVDTDFHQCVELCATEEVGLALGADDEYLYVILEQTISTFSFLHLCSILYYIICLSYQLVIMLIDINIFVFQCILDVKPSPPPLVLISPILGNPNRSNNPI